MLNRDDLKEYRVRCDLSLRDVSSYCDVSFSLISMVESGEKELTDFNYKEIIKGINAAKQAKKNGTFKQIDKAVPSSKKNEVESDNLTQAKNKNVPKEKAGVNNK